MSTLDQHITKWQSCKLNITNEEYDSRTDKGTVAKRNAQNAVFHNTVTKISMF